GDPERGRKLVESSGCLNCHTLQAENTFKAPPFKDFTKDAWTRGCLRATPAAKAPQFGLPEDQGLAVVAWAARGRPGLDRETPAEYAELKVRELRCMACHKRDGKDDAWTGLKEEVAGLLVDEPEDEGGQKFPAEQVRPTMTWFGEKLKPEWTE